MQHCKTVIKYQVSSVVITWRVLTLITTKNVKMTPCFLYGEKSMRAPIRGWLTAAMAMPTAKRKGKRAFGSLP